MISYKEIYESDNRVGDVIKEAIPSDVSRDDVVEFIKANTFTALKLIFSNATIGANMRVKLKVINYKQLLKGNLYNAFDSYDVLQECRVIKTGTSFEITPKIFKSVCHVFYPAYFKIREIGANDNMVYIYGSSTADKMQNSYTIGVEII